MRREREGKKKNWREGCPKRVMIDKTDKFFISLRVSHSLGRLKRVSVFSPCFFTLPVPIFRNPTEKMLVRMYKSFQNQVKSHLGHL